jgi:hypothetical protein
MPRLAGLVAALVLLLPVSLEAQQPVSADPQWEFRADAQLSPDLGALAGLGVNVRAGWYARVGLSASAGALYRSEAWRSQQRLDATVRFQFDPFAQRARAVYGGAGVGLVRDETGDLTGRLLVVVGMEGAARGRVVPAAELTLGGGVRLGVVLRAKRPEGR